MTRALLTPFVLGLLAFCIASETVQQLSFKIGSGRVASRPRFVRGVLAEPLIWLGVAIWVVESVAWVRVLQQAPISMAFPVMTLTYATVPLAGVLLLKEPMTRRQRIGAALILGGVVLVGASAA